MPFASVMLVNNTVDGTSADGAKGEYAWKHRVTEEEGEREKEKEGASSWPESHHYRPFDKPDKTHKECLSLVSLSSSAAPFPRHSCQLVSVS